MILGMNYSKGGHMNKFNLKDNEYIEIYDNHLIYFGKDYTVKFLHNEIRGINIFNNDIYFSFKINNLECTLKFYSPEDRDEVYDFIVNWFRGVNSSKDNSYIEIDGQLYEKVSGDMESLIELDDECSRLIEECYDEKKYVSRPDYVRHVLRQELKNVK